MRIPKIFFSSETGKPFENCMVCNTFLLKDGVSYAVEKVVRQIPSMKIKEVLFEYAICSNCMMTMYNKLSIESRQRIQDYFLQHARPEKRQLDLENGKGSRAQSWVRRCMIKGTLISKAPEYQLTAQFNGRNLQDDHMPFAISLEAIEEINSLLSVETREEMDDFTGKYFSGPPEVAELLRNRRLIFI